MMRYEFIKTMMKRQEKNYYILQQKLPKVSMQLLEKRKQI